jgi:monoterpene epsilon-lactone hydrolase
MSILIWPVVAVIVVIVFLALRYRGSDHSAYDTPQTATLMADADVSDAHADVLEKLKRFNQEVSADVHAARQSMEDMFYQEVDAEITDVDVNGIPSEWVLAEGADPDVRLLYLHGGAFRVGNPRTYRYMTAQLSARCGAAVLVIDYRMQPEFKTIHCHEDARTAYEWILHNGPEGPREAKHIFVAGDSAGGNLTLSTIAWARETGLRPADGAIAFAPLTDATMAGPSWKTNLATDPFLGPKLGQLGKIPRFVLNVAMRLPSGTGVNNPMLSPLQGELSNLPDTLIQVSRDELLFSDAQRYANKATAHGSHVSLQVWPKMVHVFQAFSELPESDDALSRVANFVASITRTREAA